MVSCVTIEDAYEALVGHANMTGLEFVHGSGKRKTQLQKDIELLGGYIGKNNFGFDYIKGLFSTLFGVDDISFFSAEGLDIYGNDPEKILSEAIEKIFSELFYAPAR